mmetsp:Transcript_119503/g.298054  ORF Transcript_119503/g.298054 Transcript_119503/m.298054 type:complete len:241 (+) Transcript_119503:274-996(+)
MLLVPVREAPPEDVARCNSWRSSSRNDSLSVETCASACRSNNVFAFDISSLRLAQSCAKHWTSSSVVSTFLDKDAKSLLVFMDLSTAVSRTSASLTNLAIRSFIAPAVWVAVSNPVFKACSSTANRFSHCKDNTAKRSCCLSICLSNSCCKAAKATLPSSLCIAAAAANRAFAKSTHCGWYGSCSIVNSGPLLSKAAECSDAPCNALTCASKEESPSAALRLFKSLRSPPGDRALKFDEA